MDGDKYNATIQTQNDHKLLIVPQYPTSMSLADDPVARVSSGGVTIYASQLFPHSNIQHLNLGVSNINQN